MSLQPGTKNQIPENSILDHFDKQAYLGNQFAFVLSDFSAGATSETPFLLLSNPAVSASAFGTGYGSLFQNLRRIISLTANDTVILRAYMNPTVTANGTAKTPVNVRPGSSNTSIAKLYESPSVSANGTLVDVIASNAFDPKDSSSLLILDPGQSLLLTVQQSAGAGVVGCSLGWFEL